MIRFYMFLGSLAAVTMLYTLYICIYCLMGESIKDAIKDSGQVAKAMIIGLAITIPFILLQNIE